MILSSKRSRRLLVMIQSLVTLGALMVSFSVSARRMSPTDPIEMMERAACQGHLAALSSTREAMISYSREISRCKETVDS